MEGNILHDGNGIVDLTEESAIIKAGGITDDDIKDYFNSLIGQTFNTVSEPFQIQLTRQNKKHIICFNVKLNKGQKVRHNSALLQIGQIINNAVIVDEVEVDFSHNTSKKTIYHKQEKVLKYVNFKTLASLNGDLYIVNITTERIKNQAPNILDLRNIRVKKQSGTNAHLSTLRSAHTVNLSEEGYPVKFFKELNHDPSETNFIEKYRKQKNGGNVRRFCHRGRIMNGCGKLLRGIIENYGNPDLYIPEAVECGNIYICIKNYCRYPICGLKYHLKTKSGMRIEKAELLHREGFSAFNLPEHSVISGKKFTGKIKESLMNGRLIESENPYSIKYYLLQRKMRDALTKAGIDYMETTQKIPVDSNTYFPVVDDLFTEKNGKQKYEMKKGLEPDFRCQSRRAFSSNAYCRYVRQFLSM